MWRQGDEGEIILRKTNMYSHVMYVWKCVRKEGGREGGGGMTLRVGGQHIL
jgi:hypothetical protein